MTPKKSAEKKTAKKAVKTTATAAKKKAAASQKAPAKKAAPKKASAKKAPAKKAVKKAAKTPTIKAIKVKKQKPEELPEIATPLVEVSEEPVEKPVTDAGGEFEPQPAGEPQRLQKILAHAGVASRRKAEEMILAGLVQVNGKVVNELGAKADPVRDHIRVDGKLLRGPERLRYYMLNKPRGYVTTVSDPEGRPTVMEFVQKLVAERVYPVGRLDYLSEGLLLLTNDGELAHKLTQAASGVEKVYLVKVAGVPSDEEIEKLRTGVQIERGKIGKGGERVRTAPAEIQLVREGDNPWFEVVLIEGRNRELRKMFEEIGHHVEKIRRVGYGPLVLDVEPGKVRELAAKEVEQLRLTAEGKLKPKRQKLVIPKAKKPVTKRWDKKDEGHGPAGGFSAARDFEQGDRPAFKPQRREGGFGGPRREGGFGGPRREGGRPAFGAGDKPRFNREKPAFKPKFEGSGDKPAFRPKREGGFGGPRNEGGFKPQRREGGFGGARREGGFGGPRREGGRPPFGQGAKRFTPGDKPQFNREKPAFKPKFEGSGDKPAFRPKREGGFGGPRNEGGFKPQRREGGFGGARREGGFGGPRREGRPPFSQGAKRFTPGDKPQFNREKPAFKPKFEGSGDKPAFRPKREGGFGGPRNEGGFKPQRREGGFGGPRREGGFGGPRREGRPQFGQGAKRFTPGDKPRFNREGGTGGGEKRFNTGEKPQFNREKPEFRPKREGEFKPKREGGFGGARKEGGSTGWKPKKPFGQGGFSKGPKFGSGGSRGGGFGGGKKPFNKGGNRPPRPDSHS